MFGLSSIGTVLKAGAVALVLSVAAGAIWYVLHLKAEVASQAQTIDNLNASVAVANSAAEASAVAAKAIAKASDDAQASIATFHADSVKADEATFDIIKETDLAPLSDKTCSAAGGLPAALVRAADGLFDAGQAR